MVTVYDKNGKALYEEPPYTEAEEREMYRRMGSGPIQILHPTGQGRGQPRPAPPQRTPPRPAGKSRRS